MSSKPAAIPLFADAYLADTMHLTTEEHGAYLLLLMAAWRFEDCSLPGDDKKLSRIAGLSPRKWDGIKDTILEFWTVDGDRIFQPRLRKERGYVLQKSESNRKNAEKRWSGQGTENKQSGSYDRISDGNAPPPPPIEEEPNGSHTPHSPPPKNSKPAKAAKIAMPPDWEPTDLSGDVGEMLAQWPPGRLKSEIAEFREYWIDDGAKRPGWDRTFRSRIRNIHDRVMRENRNGSSGKSQRRDNRDGFTRAIHDELGFEHPDQPARTAGRHDPGGGGTVGALPAPGPAALR